MKFTIEDSMHVKGGVSIEATDPHSAFERYVDQECLDAGDGDEVNAVVVNESGERWEATADIAIVRELDIALRRLKPARVAP